MQDELLAEEPPKKHGLCEKQLLSISAIISTYFLAIFLLNFFQIDFVIIGVMRELFTVPMLLAQVVFLVMGFVILLSRKESRLKYLTIMSILLLATSSTLTISSFF
jgi:hypothetical protein